MCDIAWTPPGRSCKLTPVIPARKSRLFDAWFTRYTERRLRRCFSQVLVRGARQVRELATQRPLLIVSNHTSWWDGLVILYLTNRVLDADGYALMDAKNLRRLRFFARVGAFGVDLERPQDVAAGLRLAARLLRTAGRVVWVFPQGHEVAVTARPLGFRPGAAGVARLSPQAAVVPMGLRYEFGELELPRLFVAFGAPVPPIRDVEPQRQAQEDAVTAQLNLIDEAIVRDPGRHHGFDCLIETRPRSLSRLATKALSRLAGL